ncbi:MAG: ROK family protein, partial [Nocardioidaceae bacterium]
PAIVRLADEGDAVAAGVVDSAAAAVAAAVRDCVLLLDPAIVVLGGGVGSADHRLTRQVAERVPAMLHRTGPPNLERARAGSDAGLLGAAYVAWRTTHEVR